MKIVRKYRRAKRRARRYGIAALLAAIVGVLGACSAGPELPPLGDLSEPSYTAPPPAPAPTPPPAVGGEIGHGIPETAYLLTLDDGGIYYITDEAALELGYAVCDFLDSGGSTLEAAITIEDSTDYTPYESGYITGVAIGSFCPEYA